MQYNNLRKLKIKKTLLKTVLALMAVLAILPSCRLGKSEKYSILVINSNQAGYAPYGRYNKNFADAVVKEGISADIDYFYLNCEKYDAADEISRLDSVVNSYKGRKLDMIVVNGDQATYSLLSTKNPQLRRKPIVFGAVRFPNWKLLSEYAPYNNVTGLYDSIDVVKNMEFVRDVTGGGRVITQIDDSYLDRQTVAMIDSQLAHRHDVINNMHWKYPLGYVRNQNDSVLSISLVSLRHSERMASDLEVEWRRKGQPASSCGDEADRKVIGSQNYFFMMSKYSDGFRYLMLKNEAGSKTSISLYANYIFSTIDENFDMGKVYSCVIGGYFTTWETTAADEAKIVKRILVEGIHPGDIPVTVPKKEYVADWNAHFDKFSRDAFVNLPSYVTVRNMPFKVSHPTAYIMLVHGAVTLLIILLVFFYILFRRENMKKRRAYAQLIEEKENLKLAVLGSKTYAWFIKDGKAHISDDFFRDMNIPTKSWLMNQKHSLWFVSPEFRDAFRAFIEKQKESGHHTFQFISDFGNGNRLWWEVRSTTIKSKSGKISIMGLMIDINETKRHEKELDEARKKAIEGEKLAEEARKLSREAELKQSFLSNMSHEIRTPLNAIVGFSTLIADEGESLSDEDKRMFIKDINRNTNLLLRLINDVLDIARIESGKMEFDFKKIPVNTIVEDTYNATRLQMPKHLKYIEIKCIGNPLVNVDEGRLQQVLSNFITNAGKFTPSGSVTLGCSYDEVAGEVELYVEDTGIGLTPAEQKLVFDRFYKSDKYRQGTGLGLSISKVIVDRLNGRIELKSEKGKGSRFSVILAACSADD